ncbi:leucine-rich repeat domain-containing protein [Roseibacillus ishigakijimensis]|uniref:Leucine-rich repeat domain-containing protein n=1 Tax=Roseibacillus ishigakijimensis TaxID=454146 RepID=A0A934RPS6_9BACT|nr:leucine-rich repeat domain-containing protein [Roseibacillus ishigakijimensis]MBK1833248.1 leucine-rich repeat domain-containing protein [Roseibacillus ishigakijimensis]
MAALGPISGSLLAASVEDLVWEINDGEVVITDCDLQAAGELVIPEQLEGFPVREVASWAFFNCSKLTKVQLPESLRKVGVWGFSECHNLTEIYIPSHLSELGLYTFASG